MIIPTHPILLLLLLFFFSVRCVPSQQGSNNYRDFFGVLVSTVLFTTLQLALTIYLAVGFFRRNTGGCGGGGGVGGGVMDVKGQVELLYGNGTGASAWVGLLLACGAMLLPVVVLVAQLLHFHTVLVRNRQTTYELFLCCFCLEVCGWGGEGVYSFLGREGVCVLICPCTCVATSSSSIYIFSPYPFFFFFFCPHSQL
jgi:hypothetical protein